MKIKHLSAVLFFLILMLPCTALSLTDVSSTLTDIFSPFVDPNEGTTSFRSLMIPIGGRAESLGGAYTGLADDISYLSYNPAAASVMKNTQISLFHNSWIADSNMETIAFTTRTGNFGFGGQLQCFYVPFSEYNFFGEKTSSGYYTETTLALNGAYNFLAGYNFKGIAAGGSLKASFRGVPNYADNDTNEIISGSGLAQSSLAIMADAGLLFRFNLLKFYASREPNVRLGFSLQNIGAAFTGFGNDIKIDDPLPSTAAIGISYQFIKQIVFTVEFKQPFNLLDFSEYQMFLFGGGVQIQFTSFLAMLAGFQLKGANPRFSLGAEFEFLKIRMNVNYTLDLTSSMNPVNRISLSAKIQLGDNGRQQISDKIDELYNLGVYYFSLGEYEKAIEVWNDVLELDKRYDPAILGVKSAQSMLDMFKIIRESMFLE